MGLGGVEWQFVDYFGMGGVLRTVLFWRCSVLKRKWCSIPARWFCWNSSITFPFHLLCNCDAPYSYTALPYTYSPPISAHVQWMPAVLTGNPGAQFTDEISSTLHKHTGMFDKESRSRDQIMGQAICNPNQNNAINICVFLSQCLPKDHFI